MIIARGEFVYDKKRRKLLLLGLSRENVNRLIKGEPIFCCRETHGTSMPEDEALSIHFGETEKAIIEQLEQSGAKFNGAVIHHLPEGAS